MATPLGQRVASEVEAAVVSLEALVRSARIPDAADDATTPKVLPPVHLIYYKFYTTSA